MVLRGQLEPEITRVVGFTEGYLAGSANFQPGRRVIYLGAKICSQGEGLCTGERKFPAGEEGYLPGSENLQLGRKKLQPGTKDMELGISEVSPALRPPIKENHQTQKHQ